MKVISLLQPWATLVVIGAKKIETRSWDTSYRDALAIHASKKMTREQVDLAHSQPFWDILKAYDSLPLGAIIGAVDLESTFRTERSDERIRAIYKQAFHLGQLPADASLEGLMARERAFGDYSPGRYGWEMANAIIFPSPVPAKGSMGLWEYPICRKCGCTDDDCRHCIEKTGRPCSWVDDGLCSACARQ